MRSGTKAIQSIAGRTIEPTANEASSRKNTTQTAEASFDGTPRRSSHSSIGTSVMAMTSAAVTGRKNSAPALSANGRAMMVPIPAISAIEAKRRSRFALLSTNACGTSGAAEAFCLVVRASIRRTISPAVLAVTE